MGSSQASSHCAKALYGLLMLTTAATSLAQISFCNGNTLPNGSTALCIEPSLVPMAGGAIITMKGLSNAVFSSWTAECSHMEKWKCMVGYSESSGAESIPLLSMNCEKGFAQCVSPGRKTTGDVPFYLQFMDADILSMLPNPAAGTLYLAYFGIKFFCCFHPLW